MLKLSKEKRDQLILVCVGTLVVVVGLWFGVIGTQKSTLAQTIKKQGEASARLSKGQLYLKNAATIQSNLVVATERLRALEDAMPSGDMFAWIIETLGTFKNAYMVNILNYQREKIGRFELMPDFPYTNAASFRVSMEAPYNEFGKFLADFENKFPRMYVNSFELTVPSIPDPSSPDKLSIDLEIVALMKPSSSP